MRYNARPPSETLVCDDSESCSEEALEFPRNNVLPAEAFLGLLRLASRSRGVAGAIIAIGCTTAVRLLAVPGANTSCIVIGWLGRTLRCQVCLFQAAGVPICPTSRMSLATLLASLAAHDVRSSDIVDAAMLWLLVRQVLFARMLRV